MGQSVEDDGEDAEGEGWCVAVVNASRLNEADRFGRVEYT